MLLFSICANNKIEIFSIEKLIDYVSSCKVPKFPISGDYLKEHGYESGQILGKKLKLLEEKYPPLKNMSYKIAVNKSIVGDEAIELKEKMKAEREKQRKGMN